jgi:ubiquinone/menaquinone biosynthesis C-methylase UbiE
MSDVHHPIFARVYDRASAQAEKAGQAEHRREVLSGLTGRVVEVGAGNGLNFEHYPAGVAEVVAVEPEAYLRERAEAAAGRAVVPVSVVPGLADDLPLDDETFDAAVASLVLCSVSSPEAALAEIRRVLRPGAELRYYEHVRAEDRPRYARVQDAALPVWRFFAGGCHCNRRTGETIRSAGFDVVGERRFDFRPSPLQALVVPHILGVAKRGP